MALLSKPGIVIGVLVASTTALFSIAGCGSGGGGGFRSSATSSGSPLVGTWTRSSLSVDGTSVTCPNTLTVNNIVVDSCVAKETIQFTSDGHYTETFPALRFGHLYQEYGTYSQNGDTLTLTRTATGTDTQGTGTISSSDVTTLSPSQVVTNTLEISSELNAFDLTPHVPSATAGYTVPQALDGSTVTSTYTR